MDRIALPVVSTPRHNPSVVASEDRPPKRLFVHPRMLTILGTYRCTAACQHCCFDSNPTLSQRLSLDDIVSLIQEAREFESLQTVVFSGGECFLLGDDLTKAVEHCTALQLGTRVVTNGYWAKSPEAGKRRLQELKDAGLGELNVSTGDYHQEFVEEQTVTVVNAACLGIELGLTTLIMVELQKERRVTREQLLKNPQIAKLAGDRCGASFSIIESPWMPMNRTASIEQPVDAMLSLQTVHDRKGCNSVFSTIVLSPHRELGLCCGLTREHIPELNEAFQPGELYAHLSEAGRDFIKIWLFVEGPERILAWAASKNPEIEWEYRYAHHCHACWALFDDPLVRTTIREHYRERVDDVLMRYSVMLREQEMIEGAVYA
jgi:hypothetical protein